MDSGLIEVKTTPRVEYSDEDYQVGKYLSYLAHDSPTAYSNGTGNGYPMPVLIFATTAETVIADKILRVASTPFSAEAKPPGVNRRRVAVWQVFSCYPNANEEGDLIMSAPVLLNPQARLADGYRPDSRDVLLPLRPTIPAYVPDRFLLPKGGNKKVPDLFTYDTTTPLLDVITTKPSDPTPSSDLPQHCYGAGNCCVNDLNMCT